MAVALVQEAELDAALGGQSVIVMSGAPTQGNLLTLAVAVRSPAGDALTTPTGWTAHPSGTTFTTAGNTSLSTFYRLAGASETTTVATVGAGLGAGGGWHAHVAEWSGAGGLDTSGTATADLSSAFTGGSVTPTAGAEALIYTAVGLTKGDGFGVTVTPGPDVTELWDQTLSGSRTPNGWAGYRIIDPTSGAYSIGGTAMSSGSPINLDSAAHTLVFAGDAPNPAPPGVGVEFDDEFIDLTADLRSWRIQRGADALVNGGGYTGSATFVVINRANRYNPENTESDLFGLLRDGPRVWVAINEDGTITEDVAKDVYGMFAGRVTEISVIPEKGQPFPPFVEFVCEDPLAWLARTPVRVAESRTRSQKALRQAILEAAGETDFDLAEEPSTMPLSGVDGLAGNALDQLNAASGTRHFARPADIRADWYDYVTVRRTQRLDGTAAGTVDAGTQHVTDTSGWRVSADAVINRQRATIEPVSFSVASVPVWEAPTVPFPVAGTAVQWVEFDDFVDNPVVNANVTAGTVTSDLESFGSTAKLTLVSASGTATVSSLRIEGSVARRALAESVVIDDIASQATPRGVRAGSDISGDFVGTIASARGIASHIVWRYADSKYRPDLTVENWFPDQFSLDLYDNLAVTSSHIGVTARIFEIIGLTHYGNRAADSGVVHHVTTYQLMESRVQSARTWFTLDQSLLDGDDLLAY